jgi:arsenite methyltransferase
MTNIKEFVKEHYGKIAEESAAGTCCDSSASCCGSPSIVNDFMAEKYDSKDINDLSIADLGLGCGTPTAYTDLKEGMTVLDLGSGAGIDVFIASKYIGATGKAIGLDMTEKMISKAKENAKKLGITNVEFRLGEIEQIPIEMNSIDRVISNCVINLVPDKHTAFAEIYRVLRPGGSFIISDVVTTGQMPAAISQNTNLWSCCIAGAIDKEEYLSIIKSVGFNNIQVLKEKLYDEASSSTFSLMSITVKGIK